MLRYEPINLAIRSLASDGPKQLIPIANKSNIQYCVEDLWDAGVTDIGIILGNVMPEKVQEFLGGRVEVRGEA